ncbi:hypothetical protein Tco_0253096 [Tanacetum coccineum]
MKLMKETLYELLKDYEKKQLSKNNKAKMTLTMLYLVKNMKEDKVTAIEESKYLAKLPLDELIGNLKVYEMILTSDGVDSKPIKEKVMPIALKANVTRGQTSSNSIRQDESDEDAEINLMAKNFRRLLRKGVKNMTNLTYAKRRLKVMKTQDVEGTRHLS